MAQRTRGSSPHDLVHFKTPPVGEVALTFQFSADLVDLDVLTRFASEVRDRLPRLERQPVAVPIRESFDVPPAGPPAFEFAFDPSLTLSRTWFISKDETRLVQLQGDRISLNWRRTDSMPYPRYRTLRRDLRRYFDTLRECVEAAGRTLAPINLCEVNYVNPISVGTAPKGGGHPPLALVINRLRPRPRSAFLPHVEDSQFQARWRIPGSELGAKGPDRPVGRLYFSAAPGLKPPTLEPIYIVNLVGRVMPASHEPKSAWKALDVAHKWAVLGFADLTTDEMHKAWGIEGGRS